MFECLPSFVPAREFSEPKAWVENLHFGNRTLSPLKMRIMTGDVAHLYQFSTDTGSAC